MKIIAIVTHPTKIWQILSQVGWPTEKPDFEPPYEFSDWNISQLVPGTYDGFPTIEEHCLFEASPDPPHVESCADPPHWEDPGRDPPHWEDPDYVIYD